MSTKKALDVISLSLGKILFTLLVVIAVWKGFALASRLARQRKEALAGRTRSRPGWRAAGRTVDLVRCRHCGAYFDPDAGCRCGHRH